MPLTRNQSNFQIANTRRKSLMNQGSEETRRCSHAVTRRDWKEFELKTKGTPIIIQWWEVMEAIVIRQTENTFNLERSRNGEYNLMDLWCYESRWWPDQDSEPHYERPGFDLQWIHDGCYTRMTRYIKALQPKLEDDWTITRDNDRNYCEHSNSSLSFQII